MKTTSDYLDALRTKLGCSSDGQLIKITGWSRQHISRYRQMRHAFDDAAAQRVADWLDIDAAQIVADMDAQRAIGTPAARVRDQIARIVAGTFTALCLIGFLGFSPLGELDLTRDGNIHYTQSIALIFAAILLLTVYFHRQNTPRKFTPHQQQ